MYYTHLMYDIIILYIYIYLVRHENRQDLFYGFRRRHHLTFFLFMVSVVGCFYCFRRGRKRFCYGFRRCSFFNGFRRGRKTLFYAFRRRIFDGFCRRRRIQHFIISRVIPRFFLVFRSGFRRWFFMVYVVAGKHLFL